MTTVHDPGVAILTQRLRAARELAEAAGDRLPRDLAQRLDEVVSRSSRRLEVAGDHTVAVLAGPTGVGKSSLFNAILDAEIATSGVTRPTTSQPNAAVVSSDPVGELMSHLGIGGWHNVAVSRHPQLESLVLVDLPDHDSVVTAHRARAAEVVAVADRLLWVVDPEKYADASVHTDLLAPLRQHAGVLTVLLNRSDRLGDDEVDEVASDLARLLRDDGMGTVEVVVTSAVTGRGIASVRDLLTRSITHHRAANERIAADLRALAAALEPHVPVVADDDVLDADGMVDASGVTAAAMQAAGVPSVVAAVAATHRHRARRATGWPPLRRLQARGRSALQRLGLGSDRSRGDVGTRSSRPLPHGVATATLATAVRDRIDQVTRDWPQAWTSAVDDRLDEVVAGLPARLDRAVAGTDLDDGRTPGWWVAVNVVQWVVATVMVGGGLWLLAAFVVDWLGLPSLPLYGWEGIPWATVMLLGGAAVGLFVALAATQAAKVGARRAARRVRRRLHDRIHDVVTDTVAQSLAAEASRAAAVRAHLDLLFG